ncbi:CsbD family protein [Muricoccus aerilatus]|uniref:CsbD family protein n=1 Tax=Muricoccus aerilatus TaxID=452982 RepID=UPI0005C16D7A|nr:CsbD family protein [Roseomonas aerilata]
MNPVPVPDEAERVRGSVREAVGKLTGDTKAQADGRAQKAGGKPEKDAAGAGGKLPDTAENKT